VRNGFSGLHTGIRHDGMIIPRSSENFWGANAGTDRTNYGVPLALGTSRVRKGTKPVQEQPSPPRSSGDTCPRLGQKKHLTNIISLRRRSLRRQPCSWIESTEADRLLPTTKVLVASPTQRAYGITSHLRRSPPADDQLFFSGIGHYHFLHADSVAAGFQRLDCRECSTGSRDDRAQSVGSAVLETAYQIGVS
jgi:hypothetical protein